MKYKYIIFDIDGTLLNYDEDENTALVGLLNELHIPYTDELFNDFNKVCWDEWYKLGLEDSSSDNIQKNYHAIYKQYTLNRFIRFKETINIDMSSEKLSELFLNCYAKACNLNNNAENICQLLKRDYKLYIASNGLSKIQLSRIGKIRHYFDDVFVSEDIGYIKPSTSFFNHILNKLDIKDASQCLMVGDSLECDILGANRVGMDSCWYNAKNLRNTLGIIPSYEIHDFSEIVNILNDKITN